MKTWTFDEVRPKLDGPWSTEPDKAQWIDEKTDLDCLIVRNRFGTLCGYVGLPPGHPLHGSSYGSVDVDVHGGLTFAGACQEGAEDGPGVCHVPQEGRPAEVWWLGFDCGHAFDFAPLMHERELAIPGMADDVRRLAEHQTYRTFDYTKAEVTNLAAQLSSATQPDLI